MIYHCCDAARRDAVAAHPVLNGIDYLEVLDHAAPADSPRQRTLFVRLLKPVPMGLTAEQVRVDGGDRVRDVGIDWVAKASAPPAEATAAEVALFAALPAADHVLVVRTERYGDWSPYRLRLVRSALDATPLPDFDPRLSEIAFSFKVDCPSDFDCRPAAECEGEAPASPLIDYLAKDYPTLRRLILDRIAQLVPEWRERSAADLGVTLAELLAYVGDQLSYQQDAVATEAYLDTARLRASLRRHALLVDYHLHNGGNARAWLHVRVDADGAEVTKGDTRFYGRVPGMPARIEPGSPDDLAARRARPVVFEPLHDQRLFAAHNELHFYTWGDRRCCLPAGSTTATLLGHHPTLVVGDVLLFEEIVGPNTNEPGDARPDHRVVVRLTAVRTASPDDPSAPLVDPLHATAITEIAWAADDALPLPLCVSATTDLEHGEVYIENVSVARGNMVLADHGDTLAGDEPLGTVPTAGLTYPPGHDFDRCQPQAAVQPPPRFAPALAAGPLTFFGTVRQGSTQRVPFDPAASATAALRWDMADTRPAITVKGARNAVEQPYEVHQDLMNSADDDPHFVVEVEHDGSARLRFGDDVHGRRPRPGTEFTARYRVGNGSAGNVGADTIVHVVSGDVRVQDVRNPLPARGGIDMEDAPHIRRAAPQAFRRQERAVTPADYAEVTMRHASVQRAAAALRWTGSWHTMFITVDRFGAQPVDPAFEDKLVRHVERYRMAGHDVEFNDPIYVSIRLALTICVLPGYARSDVRAGVLATLGRGVLPDGRRGLFHPDNLSFGQTIYLSRIYAACREVAGVGSVLATRLSRIQPGAKNYAADGELKTARLEIPRLDHDRSFPERGILRLTLHGGR